jgi:pyruvate carboxylase
VLKRVLIANRGEIAIRIARAAAALGMESVSVHASADVLSLHTRVTDQTWQIGAKEGLAAADPVRAYLDIDAIIEAARETGCDCVHPGYGFLAENAEFARRCLAEGLVFVGPSPEALALFGDKVAARALAEREGVAIIPGSETALASADAAAEAAGRLGYPVMLKASAGGGGRGMRRADGAGEIGPAFASAQREAEAAFGDGALFIEKLIERPRHIEVQVLADTHGEVVHLYERDCSIQLRNQKLIEIAPAPALGEELRQRIVGDALKLSKAAGLVNAATIEFLVAPNLGVHFFIECNPRIQVEHTVTEEVTGIDLVEAQFRIAAGERLGELGIVHQTDIPPPRRYAVQARVVATGAGTITAYREPAGRGVRVDSCGYLGLAPPPQFDPMFAKVIGVSNSTGTLESALERTARALDDFQIAGLPTNLASLRAILERPEVRAGDARTTLLADHPELLSAAEIAPAPGSPRSLLDAQAARLAPAAPGGGAPRMPGSLQSLTPAASLDVREGDAGVECPMAGSVVELAAALG